MRGFGPPEQHREGVLRHPRPLDASGGRGGAATAPSEEGQSDRNFRVGDEPAASPETWRRLVAFRTISLGKSRCPSRRFCYRWRQSAERECESIERVELGVHLPLIEFGDEGQSLGRLYDTVDAARRSGFVAVSANDHFVFSTPWLDGPTALAAVIDRSQER